MTIEEATNIFFDTLLVAFEGLEDDEEIPLREFLENLKQEMGGRTLAVDTSAVPEYMTAAEFRRISRAALGELARGAGPTRKEER